MPYFKNENINILFVHIPKTGGTSLEKFFSNKYNIPLNSKSLYTMGELQPTEINDKSINSSLQHLTYNTIMENKTHFYIDDTNNLEIITIVRNPYERIISDLFFLKLIKIEDTKEEVLKIIIEKYITESHDNHPLPQYLFITDENMKLIDNLKILRTESLNEDMVNLNYTDFNSHWYDLNNNNDNYEKKEINYYDYLNDESIDFINNYYDKDFELFNYKKL